MLNFDKVKKYIVDRLNNNYKNYYPCEIFEGVSVEVSSGSFGACLVSINYDNDNPHNLATVDARYVANYKDIDSLVSSFVTRNYELIASRVYEKHQKEKNKNMRCVLNIFNDNKLVNTFEFVDPEDVKNDIQADPIL